MPAVVSRTPPRPRFPPPIAADQRELKYDAHKALTLLDMALAYHCHHDFHGASLGSSTSAVRGKEESGQDREEGM